MLEPIGYAFLANAAHEQPCRIFSVRIEAQSDSNPREGNSNFTISLLVLYGCPECLAIADRIRDIEVVHSCILSASETRYGSRRILALWLNKFNASSQE